MARASSTPLATPPRPINTSLEAELSICGSGRSILGKGRAARAPPVIHFASESRYFNLVPAGPQCSGRLRVYTAPQETPILVMFKPRQGPTQLIREERIHFEPGLSPSEFEDEHGNIVYRMVLQRGQNLLRYDAIVKVPSVREDVMRIDGAVPPQDLPPSVLPYTLPSRYADSDKLRDLAWQNFGHVPNGQAGAGHLRMDSPIDRLSRPAPGTRRSQLRM